MATLADMLVGSAQQSVTQKLGPANAAGLAQVLEQARNNRAKLEHDKEVLELTKQDKMVGRIEIGLTKVPKRAQAAYFKQLQNEAGQLKMGMSDDFFTALQSPDVNQGAVAADMANFRLAYRNGLRTGDFSEVKALSPKLLEAFGGNVETFGSYMNTVMGSETAAKAQEAAQAGVAAGRREGQKREDINNRIQLTNKLVEQGIPTLKVDLGKLEKEIGGFDNWKPGTEIPGVTGESAKLPINRLSGKAARVRQAAQGVTNQILKLRSGGAISDGEANRLLSEIGMTTTIGEGGVWNSVFTGSASSETFINGMKGAKEKIGALEATLRSGYGKEIYDEVMPPSAGAGDGIKLSNGKTYSKEMLKAFIKANPKDKLAAEIKEKLGEK